MLLATLSYVVVKFTNFQGDINSFYDAIWSPDMIQTLLK